MRVIPKPRVFTSGARDLGYNEIKGVPRRLAAGHYFFGCALGGRIPFRRKYIAAVE